MVVKPGNQIKRPDGARKERGLSTRSQPTCEAQHWKLLLEAQPYPSQRRIICFAAGRTEGAQLQARECTARRYVTRESRMPKPPPFTRRFRQLQTSQLPLPPPPSCRRFHRVAYLPVTDASPTVFPFSFDHHCARGSPPSQRWAGGSNNRRRLPQQVGCGFHGRARTKAKAVAPENSENGGTGIGTGTGGRKGDGRGEENRPSTRRGGRNRQAMARRPSRACGRRS